MKTFVIVSRLYGLANKLSDKGMLLLVLTKEETLNSTNGNEI